MRSWRPLFVVAVMTCAGAIGSLVVAAALGAAGDELEHLATLLLPTTVATVAITVTAARLLTRASIRRRLLAIALVVALVSLLNLWILAQQMFVSAHDAAQLVVVIVYAFGAGIGASVALSRQSTAAIEKMTVTARRFGEGDLTARTGDVRAGPELEDLAKTLDRMAADLQASMDRERASEAARRDVITAVSHDLRTPLSDLRALIEPIDDGLVQDIDTFKRYVAGMRTSVESLVFLVDDLFELVQIDAGAIQAETRKARLEDVVHSAMATCSLQAAEKELNLESDLGDVGKRLCSPRLVRVLQNLLQNAIRHTPSDGTVKVEAFSKADGFEVAVVDTGEGMTEEQLDRIFEPFWRGDAARSSNGSGLGLTLAKRITEAVGGEIRVHSESDRGSRFALSFPDAAT